MLLASIRDSVERGFDTFFDWLPQLIGALVILLLGYIVARLIARALTALLRRTDIDERLTSGQGGGYVSRVTDSPARLIGRIAFWVIFIGAISLAVTALGIPALTDFVGAIFAYLPNVIAALLIFLVAGAVATGVAALVARTMGDTPTGKVLATVVPGLVMAIAIFMILNQLKIAPAIVTITYAALVGALALAAALAFGLGGRDVAARMLEGAYERGQASRAQVRGDLEQGKERAREDVSRAKDAAHERVEGGPAQDPAGSRIAR